MSEHDKRDPQTYAIIGAAMAVHRDWGRGFLEAVVQEALALESAARQLPCQREVPLPVSCKGRVLACHYKADFIYFNEVVVETKALSQLTTIEQAQIIN